MKNKVNASMQAFKNMHIYQLEHINQYVIECDSLIFFQSYNSLIAIYNKLEKTLIIGYDWDYSNTTLKHFYLFIKDYCYLPEIDNILNNASNKKAAIYKAIKSGLIAYDPEMK